MRRTLERLRAQPHARINPTSNARRVHGRTRGLLMIGLCRSLHFCAPLRDMFDEGRSFRLSREELQPRVTRGTVPVVSHAHDRCELAITLRCQLLQGDAAIPPDAGALHGPVCVCGNIPLTAEVDD